MSEGKHMKWSVGPASQRKAVWFGEDINAQCMDGELAEKMVAEHNAAIDALEAAEARVKELEAKPTAPAEVPSDEDLAKIGEAAHTEYWATTKADHAWENAVRAVREAVAAHYEAEIDSLRDKLEAAEKEIARLQSDLSTAHRESDKLGEKLGRERDFYEAEIDRLRDKLAAAEKERDHYKKSLALIDIVKDAHSPEVTEPTTPRPVRVRFCIDNDDMFVRVMAKANAAGLYLTEVMGRADYVAFGKIYTEVLSKHAIVDVPEGVPTAEELADLVELGEQTVVVKAKADGGWPFEELAKKSYECAAQLILERLAPYLTPSAAVDPKLCERPFKSASEVQYPDYAKLNVLQTSDEQVVSMTAETRYSRDDSEATLSPAAAHRAGMWLLSFAASQGIDVRLPVRDEQPPIADADTLEELAEIAYTAWLNRRTDHKHHGMVEVVTAVLRAARPYIQCSPQWLHTRISATESRKDLLDYLNSRIRYRVVLPDDPDPDIATAAYMLGRHDQSDDLRRQQRECYERVYIAAQANSNMRVVDCHEDALEAARTLPKRLADLDAAIKGRRCGMAGGPE